MAKWTRILAAAAAKMKCRPAAKRCSTVAPQPPSFAVASEGGMLPPSNADAPLPHRWLNSVLAKMRRGSRPSAEDRKRVRRPRSRCLDDAPSATSTTPRSRKIVSSAESKRGPASAATTGLSEATPACSATLLCNKALSEATSSASAPPGFSELRTLKAAPSTSPACSATLFCTKSVSAVSPSSSPPPPSPLPPCSVDHRFNDYWYKTIALGGAVLAFLYNELKASLEKEVDKKVKEKELKDKDKLLLEKQDELNKRDSEIQKLQTQLKERKKSWF